MANRFNVVFPANGPLRMFLAALVIATVSCTGQETVETTTAQPEPAETRSSPPTTSQPSTTPTPAGPTRIGVLVFHKTAGFRHNSIEAGIQALEELAETHDFAVTASEDASVFSSDGLEPYDVVVFLNTTGDVLDQDQEGEMEEFIRAGNGFVGIHSAADTEYEWEWYGGLVGAYFADHPAPQPAMVEIAGSHPVVEGLPEQLESLDEWYNFREHPGPEVTVLATLDESTYKGGTMGEPHPIIWAQEYDGGRAVYIGFGHTSESFSEPLVRTLLANAISWTADR